MTVTDLVGAVRPVDEGAAARARDRQDRLAKPPGSLGALERLSVRLAAIARRCPPPVPGRAGLVICAADHGAVASGASIWPSAVTAAMVATFISGRAAANALAAEVGADLLVVDVGVAGDLPDGPGLRRARVRPGTADITRAPAMTRDEAQAAMAAGAAAAAWSVARGRDLVVCGDMGIGNTAAAACLIACFTGAPAAAVTGPGAGGGAAHLAAKRRLVAAALERRRPDPSDPLGALSEVGGLEHAALAGVMLGAAGAGVPVVLDGVSTNAAALVATALCPDLLGYLIAGHRSTEPGAAIALERLGLEALLDLGLRLGEGTGGLLAVPLVRAAARALGGMATLEEIGGG